MKRAKWYLPLLLVSILLFVGGACGPPEPEVVVPPSSPIPYSKISIPIGEFRNHPHIDAVMHAAVGESLIVTLGSNRTTGFRWSEVAEISDETIVRQVSHQYVGKEYETPPPPGTSGEEVWVFQGLKEGTVIIFLEYSRPWNPEDIGHWTVTITANIKL